MKRITIAVPSDDEGTHKLAFEAAMAAVEEIEPVYRGWVDGTSIGRYGNDALAQDEEGMSAP